MIIKIVHPFKFRFLFLLTFFICISFYTKLSAADEPIKEVWKYKTGGNVRGSAYDPENKRIFCGSNDNHLYCLDSSGKLIWKYKTGSSVFGIAYDPLNKRVFCGSFDDHLYCLDSSGNLIWKYKTGGSVFGVAYDPLNRRVFCGSHDKHVHCIDDNSGNPLWKYKTDESVIIVFYEKDKEQVFFGSNDNHLYCLDSSGKLIWKHETEGSVRGIAYDKPNDRVVFGSCDNHLYCVDSSGNRIWKCKTGGEVKGVAYDHLSGRSYCKSLDGYINCVNSLGELVWKYPCSTGDEVTLAIDPENHLLFCPSNDYHLYVLSYGLSEEQIAQAKLASLEEENRRLKKERAILCEQIAELSKGANGEQLTPFIRELLDENLTLHLINQKLELGKKSLPLTTEELEKENISLKKKSQELQTLIDNLETETYRTKTKELGSIIEYCPTLLPQAVLCPTIIYDHIYFVSNTIDSINEQILHCYNQDFEEIWAKRLPTTFSNLNPPTIDSQENLYYLSHNKEIMIIENQEQFTLLNDQNYTTPAIGENGLLYFSTEEGTLYCINPKTKGTVWLKETQESIYPNPCINQEIAYFASPTTLYAIDSKGKTVLKENLFITSPLRIDPQGNLYYLSSKDVLTCVSSEGKFLWNYESPNITLPAFDSNYVYIASDTKIHSLNLEGEVIWKKNTNTPIKLSPTSNSKGEVYFLSEKGNLYRKRDKSFFERCLW